MPFRRPVPSFAQARRHLAAALLGCLPAVAAPAQIAPTVERPPEPAGPALAAASNFSQGRLPRMMAWGLALPVRDFRDGIAWARAETAPGVYDFSDPLLGFPASILGAGADLSLVLNWGNPLYDGGNTPHTEAGRAAMGRFAVELLTVFPGLDSLEIGNEFNGTDFVRGPLREMRPDDRARAYAEILETVHDAARAVRPDIRLLGGAVHSLPAGYLWALLDTGAARHMDALAVHPYTTPAEQLARQIGVLRRHPDAAAMPFEVTEFAHPDPDAAAGHLLRNYCQMALSGVTRAVWYPLNARGDGLVPLIDPKGRITGAGRAYRMAQERFAGQPATDAATDPFTYGCRFGDRAMLIWGDPRQVHAAPGLRLLDDEERELKSPATLSRSRPLVIVADEEGALDGLDLPVSTLLADSYDQFHYPYPGMAQADLDPFERFARRDGEEIPLGTLPGQEVPGTPWHPYRGDPGLRPLRLTAEHLLPAGHGRQPVEIVHRYVAPEEMSVDLDARFAPARRSQDGITLRVTLDGEELDRFEGKEPMKVEHEALALAKGAVLEISVGPNETARGDVTSYRITLRRR